MAFENKNYAFAASFVEELARSGLKHVCICPGSRSSPLAISFARNPEIKKWVHLDERSAAFFALGMAKSLGQPVSLVCSSGTATANFFPAIIEAHFSMVPLLVLTADRPPEMQDWGALQTIDQTRLYGSHVKWSATLPVPEASAALLAFVRSMAARAISTVLEKPRGPVHLNFPFREPLEPASRPEDFPQSRQETQNPGYCGCAGGQPFLAVASPETSTSSDQLQRLARELAKVEKGLIICGPESDPNLISGVVSLAAKLGYPILGDCLSQVRCGEHDRRQVIENYDLFISDKVLEASLVPQVVVRFGALPVSKPMVQFLELHPEVRHILLDGGAAWRDPLHIACESWKGDPVSICVALADLLPAGPPSAAWLSLWIDLCGKTRKSLAPGLESSEGLFEGRIFSELSRLLKGDTLLFVGNSMPVRDLDTFFPSCERSIRFMANRGASGIDGVVSTALGAGAAASGKLVLVIGDISFYHDMNGLLAARAFNLDATIIVINNNGGGIFSFLPQSKFEDVFEPYFGTPHGLTFEPAAKLYGLDYCLARDWATFRGAVGASLAKTGTTIIEVLGDRQSNVLQHQKIRDGVAEEVKRALGRGT